VLILAAGVSRAFERRDFTVVAVGYVVMRLALVGQWLRAITTTDLGGRPAALRYAIGVSACQVGWLLALALPTDWGLAAFPVLALAELLVPVWAERAAPTTWHPRHIAERHGLFTLIVLGESKGYSSVSCLNLATFWAQARCARQAYWATLRAK
jgi:low temperature requirement protein LtrA